MNRDEIALESEHLDLLEALTAAKEAHRAAPSDETRAALADAKSAVVAFRAEWRGIRDALKATPSDGDAVAQPAVIKTTTKVRS